jgi:DNA-binding PucR family transcriptional regulator
MTARLSELLAVPGLQDARLITGDPQSRIERVLGRSGPPRVISATLAAGPPAVLVLMDPVTRFDTAFDVLLRRASQAGIVTVAFASSPGAEPGRGTTALADRLHVGLLAVPEPWEASIQLHEQLASSHAPAVRLITRAAQAALEAGPDVTETLHRLETALGYPLSLLDASGHTLEGTAVLDDAGRSLLIASSTGGHPVQVPDRDGGQLVAAAVGTGIGPRAWLAAAVPRSLPMETAGLLGALQTAGIAVGHRLALARLADERDAQSRTSLLDELRAAGSAPPPELAQRAIRAGWPLDAWHIGIRIVPRGPADPIAQRSDILDAFARRGLAIQAVEQDTGWAAWVSYDSEPSVTEVRSASAGMRRAQADLRSRIATNVGVGSVQAGASGLVRTVGEAADAARLATNRPETGHFVHIDTLGLAQLLLAWTQTDTFLPAARELLAPLDRAGGQLLITLGHYLDTGASVAETAAILDVHRNTVTNRLAQIQRLLGVDLADPETRLALHLASRTLR